jgi:hypothetical protein
MSDSAGLVLLAGRIIFALFFAVAGYRHVVGGKQMTDSARRVRFPLPVAGAGDGRRYTVTHALIDLT